MQPMAGFRGSLVLDEWKGGAVITGHMRWALQSCTAGRCSARASIRKLTTGHPANWVLLSQSAKLLTTGHVSMSSLLESSGR